MTLSVAQTYHRADWDHTARTRVVADIMLGQIEAAPDAGTRQEIFGRLQRYLGSFSADEVDAARINARLKTLGLPLVEGGSSEGKRPLSEMPLEMKQGIQRFESLRASSPMQQAVLAHVAELTGGSLTAQELSQAQSMLAAAARR